LSVPIFADSSFGKKLDLSLAGRYSDYSTFGGEFTPIRPALAGDR
jgi:iron complex outermembrane receptor protein